jgi:hypothetical protein
LPLSVSVSRPKDDGRHGLRVSPEGAGPRSTPRAGHTRGIMSQILHDIIKNAIDATGLPPQDVALVLERLLRQYENRFTGNYPMFEDIERMPPDARLEKLKTLPRGAVEQYFMRFFPQGNPVFLDTAMLVTFVNGRFTEMDPK